MDHQEGTGHYKPKLVAWLTRTSQERILNDVMRRPEYQTERTLSLTQAVEIRVENQTHKQNGMTWALVNTARQQVAEKIRDNPCPMADRRFLEDPKSFLHSLTDGIHEQQSFPHLLKHIEFRDNTPVRWNISGDMLAQPYEEWRIVLDPRQHPHQPMLDGTAITLDLILTTLQDFQMCVPATARELNTTDEAVETALLLSQQLDVPKHHIIEPARCQRTLEEPPMMRSEPDRIERRQKESPSQHAPHEEDPQGSPMTTRTALSLIALTTAGAILAHAIARTLGI